MVMEPPAAAVDILSNASTVAVLTGAGMSAESGVPTFRDAMTGLWSRYDPTELATPEAFSRHPARVFGWYLWRWRAARGALPHAGHRALVDGAATWSTTVVTQNVDGLHQRAGSTDVIELHGSLHAFHCSAAQHPFDVRGLEALPEAEEVEPPCCERCGARVRPAVVWFGELLPAAALERAGQAAAAAEVLIVVGTSAVVYPAAQLPHLARAAGARLIEINPNPTPLSALADVTWCASAGAALPTLFRAATRARTD